jgi:hypothetical protein
MPRGLENLVLLLIVEEIWERQQVESSPSASDPKIEEIFCVSETRLFPQPECIDEFEASSIRSNCQRYGKDDYRR